MLLLEPTCPLRSAGDISACIDLLVRRDKDAVATFREAALNPHRAWTLTDDVPDSFIPGADPWLPRQALPRAYQLNGAVYCFRPDRMPPSGASLLFGNTGAVVMPLERSVDIDAATDFLVAEQLLSAGGIVPPGKTLLITGASSGVGLSLAHHFADHYKIIATARRIERLRAEFADEPSVHVYRMDLADTAGTMASLETILDEHGHIPYLISNAGVNVAGRLEELEEREITRSLQVNAVTPAMIMRRLLPAMRERDFGRIIAMTSGAPLNCFPGYGAYSASKAALNTLVVTAAHEYGDADIKINLMSPGPVKSEMAPDGPLDASVCHPTADHLLSLGGDGPTGRFFWLGYEIPLFPDLDGIEWLQGRADSRYPKAF